MMGARGPAPIKKTELTARGSRRAGERAGDLEFESKAPKPPTTLSREARAEWNRVVPLLAEQGVLSEADRAGLVALCEAWAMHQAALAQSRKTKWGTRLHREALGEIHRAFQRWSQLAARFGLTPADRPRVKVSNAGSSNKNKAYSLTKPSLKIARG